MEGRNAGMIFQNTGDWPKEGEAHTEKKGKEKRGFHHASTDADAVTRQALALARDWGYARENMYPILMPADDGRLLEGLVHFPVMDLAVTYAVRLKLPGARDGIIRVKDSLLETYGVNREELHERALLNMGKDGYHFERVEEALCGIPGLCWDSGPVRMYVLTNRTKTYGAAGLLNKGIVGKFTKDCDYYIIPSSIHELIFIPASDVGDAGELDRLVEDISRTVVMEKERLSYHSYFYDAFAQEARICR